MFYLLGGGTSGKEVGCLADQTNPKSFDLDFILGFC